MNDERRADTYTSAVLTAHGKWKSFSRFHSIACNDVRVTLRGKRLALVCVGICLSSIQRDSVGKFLHGSRFSGMNGKLFTSDCVVSVEQKPLKGCLTDHVGFPEKNYRLKLDFQENFHLLEPFVGARKLTKHKRFEYRITWAKARRRFPRRSNFRRFVCPT